MRSLAFLLSAPLLLAGCSTVPPASNVLGIAEMRMVDGRSAGMATLLEVSGAVVMDVEVTGVPSGSKGLHLHTTGLCTPPDFQSAGGHLNPMNRAHGLASAQGPHLGDLPNLQVEPTGTTRARFDLPGSKVELLPVLFDGDGTSVMIHAEADDNLTDPSGNSGSRVVCGVLRKPA